MAGAQAEDTFKKFYVKLVKVLPINNISSDLYSHNLLPGDHKARIDGLDTPKQKAEYFLDHVIKPGVEIGYTGQFDEMLKVMENSDDPPVKFLAGEIKKYINSKENVSSLLNVSKGHFGVLPCPGKCVCCTDQIHMRDTSMHHAGEQMYCGL